MPTVQSQRHALEIVERSYAASTPEEYERAARELETIVELLNDPIVYSQLGRMYRELRIADRSTAAFRAASLLEPESAGIMSNVTCFLRDFDREAEAIAILKCALRRNPTLTEGWHNLGAMLRNTGDLESALACFEEANPPDGTPLVDLGMGEILTPLGRSQESVYYAQRAAQRSEPGSLVFIEAMMASGLARLAHGELGAGWDEIEARLDRPGFRALTPPGLPAWNGPGDSAEHVLVWREQGIGDEIRFLSCLPDILADTNRVTVRCTNRLASIIQRTFGVDVITGTTDVPETADAHISMGTLMRHYRRSLDAFPATTQTLTPDPAKVAHWKARLAELGGDAHVGLSWRSRVQTTRRSIHYPDLASLASLGTLSGVTLIDLQYDHNAAELNELRDTHGLDLVHFEDLDLMNDLEGVFALAAALDAVIVVGNSVSEIAGSVGTPTYEINVDHTPLAFGQIRSSWHPTVTMCTRAWNEPWSVAIAKAVDALTQQLATPHTAKEQL